MRVFIFIKYTHLCVFTLFVLACADIQFRQTSGMAATGMYEYVIKESKNNAMETDIDSTQSRKKPPLT